MGVVAAIRFYWMAKAPSIAPPAPEPEVTERPRRRSQVDLMAMPIEPVEAYLLSMIDGEMDLDELSSSIGKDVKETRAMLRRLAGLGAVAWRVPHPSRPPSRPPSRAPTPARGRPRRPRKPTFEKIDVFGRGAARAGRAEAMPEARLPASATSEAAPDDTARTPSGETAKTPPGATSAQTARTPSGETAKTAPGATSEETARTPSGEAAGTPAPEARPETARTPAPPDAPSPSPTEALGGADLDPSKPEQSEPASGGKQLDSERKRLIDDAHALVGEADHYELLGVHRDADKKAIRQAYFRLAKLFHTDTLYGAELGSYGAKMDRVFQALTEAYEVLSKKKKRRAYDAYLAAVQETDTLDAPPEPRPSMTPGERASRRPPADPSPDRGTPQQPRASSLAARRERTRRLLEKRSLASPRAPGREAILPPTSPKAAVDSLARTLEAVSRAVPRDDRVSRLVRDATNAEREGNVTGAAEAMRIASAWRPNDEHLAAEAARLRREALVEKAPAFERRARYAEKNGNWQEAALAWTRVTDVHPDDPEAALGAARALLESQGDLKEAASHGKRAVQLAPKHVEAHLVLARIYVAAGMRSSAKRSVEAALAIDPRDERAKGLLDGLR